MNNLIHGKAVCQGQIITEFIHDGFWYGYLMDTDTLLHVKFFVHLTVHFSYSTQIQYEKKEATTASIFGIL